MKIGCVKETQTHEYRVGLTPGAVRAYVDAGHSVTIEYDAGEAAGFENEAYQDAGASLEKNAKTIWENCDMMIKVKAPTATEQAYFKEDLILFTYLHLASDKEVAEALLKHKVNSVAYETIQENGILPCLKPMSEIAGKLSIQEGAKYLERPFGGRGVLLGGVPGVEKGRVVVLGGGVVGVNACRMALGLGADVTVLDRSVERLSFLDDTFGGTLHTLHSTQENIETAIAQADLVIGAVLIPGASAPKLVTKYMLKMMKKNAVIVDVAVDQGGCFETTRATTHENPTYQVENILHYCVTNMPGAVPRTSTSALVNATLPYGLKLASDGIHAVLESPGFMRGLNTAKGKCVNEAVAQSLGYEYTPVPSLFDLS